MDFNPDYLTKPETEKPELLAADCETFSDAQAVFNEISSEYRIALAIGNDYDVEDENGVIQQTDISKTGGLPLFPSDMEWPLCEKCGEEMSLKYQIRKQDAPALPTPKNKDVFLLFLCPENCGDEQPEHEIIWLTENEITAPLKKLHGRNIPAKQISFHPFRDHLNCSNAQHDDLNLFNSHLSECKIRYDVRMIARMMEGIADNSLDERLKEYGDNPLAQLESMNNESFEFFEGMQMYHLEGEKIGGYPSWSQNAVTCHGPYMNILQIKWAEGFWHIVVCPECGDIYTEYQGG